jgi:lysozyme family protein
MSDFAAAEALLLQWEGALSDDAGDGGGLTIFGITETYDGDWPGWPVVRHLLAIHDLKKQWSQDPALMAEVGAHYLGIWDRLGLGALQQPLANSVLGGYVNQGPRVIRWLQLCLQGLGKAVKTDSLMAPGGETVNACLLCDQGALLARFKQFRQAAYMSAAFKHANQEKFLQGWLNRLEAGA